MGGHPGRSHLFLLLSRKGMGEAILGLRLAQSLIAAGDSVSFICHHSNTSLLPPGSSSLTLQSEAAKSLPLYVQIKLHESQTSSIILGDYLTTSLFFETEGIDVKAIQDQGVPVVGIDIWDSGTYPQTIDVFMGGQRTPLLWPDLVRSICPVPFLAAHSGAHFYQDLPAPIKLAAKVKKHIRTTLGLSENDKAVLFCTAAWQHAKYESADGVRLALSLPELMGQYIARMGPKVHLVHIGPVAYDLAATLGERYHWIPPLPPERFDSIVASVDLLLSANISATTIAKSMVYQVPTLVLENSYTLTNRAEADGVLPSPPSVFLSNWLYRSLPLYPFSLWPLGYYQFLKPLMKDNPYRMAQAVVELLHEEAVEATLKSLLFDSVTREEQLHRRTSYLQTVHLLQSGAEVVQKILGGAV
jgi:hypothetical protein